MGPRYHPDPRYLNYNVSNSSSIYLHYLLSVNSSVSLVRPQEQKKVCLLPHSFNPKQHCQCKRQLYVFKGLSSLRVFLKAETLNVLCQCTQLNP